MDGGQYYRDVWGFWWFEQPDGAWFRHDGTAWQLVGAPNPEWFAAAVSSDYTASGSDRRNRNWVVLAAGGLVLVLVAVLVAALLQPSGSGGSSSSEAVGSPADPTVLHEVTHIPVSVDDQVSTVDEQVVPPTVVNGHGAFTVDGKPGVFFYGYEYCPYCATERWAVVAALSRFGTWHGLRNMASSSTDVYPNTPTFTFRTASFTSPYIGFESVEALDRNNHRLQVPTPSEVALLSEMNASGAPFMDMGNRVLVTGASFDPSVLSGKSRAQIAAGLTNGDSPATAGIVATANYLTAGICAVDGQQPSSVCSDPAVSTAAAALGLAS